DVMHKFKNGECNILIATDVSARGIDIPDVNYVVNYDLPEKPENYVHRVGRTGRGVRKGIAISFCSADEKERLDEIQQLLKKEIEVIKISKRDYARAIAPSPEDSAQALIDEYENRQKKRTGKAKKRK
ncbi:MAG: ATP-dependent helicase, partial [Deltaproteobacteria bacterium]|nr:ATP-dependent helicase [Deltaproteobacteria bacterium]